MVRSLKPEAPLSVSDKIWGWFNVLIWVGSTLLLLHYTNMVHTIRYDSRVNVMALYLAVFACSTVAVLFSYLIVHTRVVVRVKISNMYMYSPRIIQLATLLSFVSYFSFVAAIFPIWGYTSFLLIFVTWMGLIFALNFIPDC